MKRGTPSSFPCRGSDMGLSDHAKKAWAAAYERAKADPTLGTPERIPLHSDQVEEYKVKSYVVEVVGPEWWNLSCTCKGAGTFGIICKHRALVAAHRKLPGVKEDMRGICIDCGKEDHLVPAIRVGTDYRKAVHGRCAECDIERQLTALGTNPLQDLFE